MKTSDFNYQLPKSFIANYPAVPRDSSRLMIYDCAKDVLSHCYFYEITEFLRNSVLVLNNSKVIPARIVFESGSSYKEIFLLRKLEFDIYEVLVKPGKFFKKGKTITINKDLNAEILDVCEDGSRIIKFLTNNNSSTLEDVIFKSGTVPLPPYIDNPSISFDKYQTVYSKEPGSVAAPTAGLHFTENLLNKIKQNRNTIEEVLLHVGRGTFQPVSVEDISNHFMHSEFYQISPETSDALNKSKREGRKIVAVGTTSVRVLESNFHRFNSFSAETAETDIFIYPGKHKWKAVDHLITNFHLPKSTLIMLVASFLEHKGITNPVNKILELYEIAKSQNYRFYSFGDAMLIL